MNMDRFRPECECSMKHEKPESYPDDYKPQCECNQPRFKPGDKVSYLGGPLLVYEHGIVKGYHPASRDVVFVVYKCGEDWEHYQNYTACATDIANLEHGWL